MKKKGLFILLGLICIADVGGSGALFITRDKTGPKIIVSEDRKIAYSTDSDKKVLLDGVTAIDEKDGDVSDSLRVESVRNNEDGSLEVTYSAVDDSNNVTKLTCKVETLNQENSDKDAKEENTENTEASEENQEENQENTQQDEEDKEAQSQEEANQEEVDDSDSDTDAAIAALPEGSPQLRLSTHQVDLQVGASFQYMDYIESISDDKDETNELYRKIYLTGEVNTSQAGNYEISYYVTDSDKNQSNIEKLTVTVHE